VGIFLTMRSAAGGRNEEAYSKYAIGIRVKQYPSRRQQRQKEFEKESWVPDKDILGSSLRYEGQAKHTSILTYFQTKINKKTNKKNSPQRKLATKRRRNSF